MDAFYASVEQLDNPDLKNKPVIIGSDSSRGVVSTCSYEARVFGVRSAMPNYIAKAKCPQGIFVYPRMSRYMEVSKNIHESLKNIFPIVEMASVDEAYIDASGMENLYGNAIDIANKIKKTIYEASGGLTCSIGIAPIKFLAKIASDENKPNGLFIIEDDQVKNFINSLPIGKIPGVGKKFLEQLKKIGIYTCADVLKLSHEYWQNHFNKAGTTLFERANGIDLRSVEPYTIRKSESSEITFKEDILDKKILKKFLKNQAERVGESLRKHSLKGRTITLKVKYSNFKQITRQLSIPIRTNCTKTIYENACKLLDELKLEKALRLIGLGVTNFENDLPVQLSLFDSPNINQDEKKQENLDNVLDQIKLKYGKEIILRGDNQIDFEDNFVSRSTNNKND